MSRVSAVILAAGKAMRAGGPKVAWPVEGLPSVRRVAEAALGARAVTEVLAVTGAWEAEVREALRGLAVKIVPNPDYAAGQSASLAAALRAVEPGAGAALFLLADQPFITSQIIGDLVQFARNSSATIVAPLCRGRRRNPALFKLPRWRDALLQAGGDRGGRGLIEAHPEELALCPFDDAFERCFLDFDTPAEYERMLHAPAQHPDNH
ncbi:MAG: nucleotidyltransferase family protein [Candidatus Adiutrix sp.]|jgi:molybdenum cofactor cytidylyltransferase|nr:nucleotidyltransferase family protein [Candidatus Adiutrix sp.]